MNAMPNIRHDLASVDRLIAQVNAETREHRAAIERLEARRATLETRRGEIIAGSHLDTPRPDAPEGESW